MKPPISVIGIGNMGSAIAERLLARDYEVYVFNRTADKAHRVQALGATMTASAAEALSVSDLIISGLVNGEALKTVLLSDVTKEFLQGRRVMNIAQTTPLEVEELAEAFADAGARLSEVEVIAYPADVRAGQSEFVLAGPDEDSAIWSAIFGDLGGKVHHVGAVGRASRVEMAFWLPFAFQTIAVAYTVAAFEKEHLPISVLESVLKDNPVLRMPSAAPAIQAMVAGKFGTDQWSVDNMVTSLNIAIEYARAIHLPVAIFEKIQEAYAEAARRGFGSQDHAAVYDVICKGGEAPGREAR